MRDTRSLLASIGASSALVAAATLALLSASAIVAFHGWPGNGGASGAPLALPAEAAQSPGRILVPVASRRAVRTVVRRASSSVRRGSASRTPSAAPRRPARTVVRTPSSAPASSKPIAAAPAPAAGSPVLSVPATPSAPPVPDVAPQSAPVPAPVAGPVDQAAEAVAAAPSQATDVVAGPVPKPQVAAGDPR